MLLVDSSVVDTNHTNIHKHTRYYRYVSIIERPVTGLWHQISIVVWASDTSRLDCIRKTCLYLFFALIVCRK